MIRPAATRKFGEKREAIIHAAAVLINEVGVQATTLAEVARAIGLNATSVTYYFPRKEQLVVAVYDQTLTLMEDIARDALSQADPAARLRHFIAAHVELRKRIRAGERGLTVALSEIRTLDPEVQDPLMAHYLRVVDLVRRFFGEWHDNAERALFS
ncbi:TetR/AcrR family transcriptional regulator, partial [Erythrobacter sp. HI0077]